MSSEISKPEKTIIEKIWIKLHRYLSHNNRIKTLSSYLISFLPENEKLDCLDVGCGDMKIAETIMKERPLTDWICLDIYELPENLKGDEKYSKYRSFDGLNMPFNSQKFDYVLLCDVLHHSLDQKFLLSECARVGEKIIIKDHFQYGFFSNLILKWMDIFGNRAYGVHIPGHYFTQSSFDKLCNESGLRILKLNIGIKLYDHLPIIRSILSPKWQFIAILEESSSETAC